LQIANSEASPDRRREDAGRRLAGLDALRGIAALSVVLYHFTCWYPEVAHAPWHAASMWIAWPYGHLGIELFFLISGFVILMTLERSGGIGDFAFARFARLFPGYWTALALTVASLAATGAVGLQPTPLEIAANLTMAPALFWVAPVDGAWWTLAHELAFYTLAGAAYFLWKPRRIEFFCLAWLVPALAYRLHGGTLFPYPSGLLLAAQFAPLFVLGMLVYRTHQGRASALTFIACGAALALLITGPQWSFRPITGAAYVAVILALTLLVGAAASGRLPFLDVRPLRFLGEISYTLYLTHHVIGFLAITALEAGDLDPNIAVALTLAMAIALAWTLTFFIERPVQRHLRNWFARHRRGPSRRAAAIGAELGR
jgi:peptidoglycan/LPS O-acetylase OafA/YrhL